MDFSNILKKKFLEKRARNPSFSLRAFARHLSLSPSALSEIMRDKRRVSLKYVKKIAPLLNLDTVETKAIAKELKLRANQAKKSDFEYTQLDMEKYQVIAEWYHFAILSLSETFDFEANPSWIAKRLNITERQAKTAIQRLIKLNLLKKQTLRATHDGLSTTDEVPSEVLRGVHATNLDLARDALEITPLDLRDFTGITLAIDLKHLAKAKQCIRRFQDQMAKILECDSQSEVYKLCVQLYPLSRRSEK